MKLMKKIDYIFMNFLFDLKDNTELLKSAILIKYEKPHLKMDEIMKKVVEMNPTKVKNTKSAYLNINRSYTTALKRHTNLDEFTKILPPAFKYNPTTKNFINGIAKYLVKEYK